MKKALLSIVLVLTILTCVSSQERNDERSTDSTIIAAIGQVRSDSLLSYIQSLQDFGTRFMIAPNRKEIATWIMDKFIAYGMTDVRLDSFASYTYVNAPPFMDFDTTTWQYNVEAKITGSVYPLSEMVMMGHYDDCVSYSDPMSLTPGADDNASGVAALLECARVIMETGHQPRQTFIFLATAAEELMYSSDCGSQHYAEEASAEGREISMVLNNDMIGWNDGSWTVSLVTDINSQHITNLAIHIIDNYTTLNRVYATLGTYADLTYFLDKGYEGIYFMESFVNGFYPYYHTIYDQADQVDPAYLSEITRLNLGCFLLSDLMENDAELDEISVPESNCSESASPMLTITNYGSDTITSMDMIVRVNEDDPVIVPWTGSIAFQESGQVVLQEIPFDLLPENEIEITLENINGTEDELPMNNSLSSSFGVAIATPGEIYLKIRLDDFPGETSWNIKNSNDDTVYSGGPYTTPNGMVEETFIFDDPGCYTFTVYDAGGDGLHSGFILLYYGSNSVILSVLEFNSFVQTQFDVGGTMQTEEIIAPGTVRFYPNPVHNAGYIAFELDKASFIEATIFNLIGQKEMVLSSRLYPPGSHLISFSAEKLAQGLYFLSVQIGSQVVTFKLIK